MEAPWERPKSASLLGVIVGDWAAVPAGVCAVHETRGTIRRVAPDVRPLTDSLVASRPAWVLFGCRIDEWTIRALLSAVRAVQPTVTIAMLGPTGDSRRAARWMRRGCHVYLDEGATVQRVVQAIELAATHRVVVVDRGFQDALIAQQVQPVGSLTRREEEVLQLLCLGLRNVDIANSLHLTENTVEFHVSRLLAKLGVRNRVEAADRANALGLT